MKMLPVIRPIYSAYDSTIIGFSYIQISFKLFTETLQDYAKQEDTVVYLTLGNTLYEITGKEIVSASSIEPDFFKDHANQVQPLTVSGKSVLCHCTFDQ